MQFAAVAMRLVTIAAGTIAAPPSALAQAHRLECPASPPKEWGILSTARLDQTAVLSQLTGKPIDDRSPPYLVPDTGFARRGFWHNIWRMGDEQGWSHFIDCRYHGSTRVLRLPADGMRQCEQTAQPYAAKGGIAADAIQTMICD
jgi:hypothetical protein